MEQVRSNFVLYLLIMMFLIYRADDRIHCVFYFIAPHRMKDIDVEFISQLAPLVPIIPVIPKSDIMTVKERNYYLDIVQSKINSITKQLNNEPCVYDFEGDDMEAVVTSSHLRSTVDSQDDEIPESPARNPTALGELKRVPNLFSIICDNNADRIYPWGGIKIGNNDISDFRRLQTILFENGKL